MDLSDLTSLANLARLEVPHEELAGLSKDFEVILDYVSQIKDAPQNNTTVAPLLKNVLREDSLGEPFAEPRSLVEAAQEHTDTFVKVPKVIE